MAELKRNFNSAKMNKDMDERVLPSGQYRDALNVQIASSDGSNLGSLQTLLGNAVVSNEDILSAHSKCVGSVTVGEENNIYYFISRGGGGGSIPDIQKDFIVRYNTILKTSEFIFVDIFSAKATVSANNTGGNQYLDINTGSNLWTNGIRVGMLLTGDLNDPGSSTIASVFESNNAAVTDVVSQGSNVWRIYYSGPTTFKATSGDIVRFKSDRVLQFQHHIKVHNINHLEGMLFWTDGFSEPRKIHIERSEAGTGGTGPLANWNLLQTTAQNLSGGLLNKYTFIGQNNSNFHTRLCKRRGELTSALEVCTNRVGSLPINARLDHQTVIKKGPNKPLELCMFSQAPDRINDDEEVNPIFATTNLTAFGDIDGAFDVGTLMTLTFGTVIDLRVGDTVLLIQADSNLSPSEFPTDKAFVSVQVLDPLPNNATPPNTLSVGPFNVVINSVSPDAGSSPENWLARVELEKPLFEYKFPRFSYRWRYQDGEYSTFAPWSCVAFIPGDFDYMPKKGFNLGMTNRLRYLKLKNYFPEFAAFPEDVVEIDLLYKEAGKAEVYTVKTVKPKHGSPTWSDYKANYKDRGTFEITSEMIHAIVPSNQLLRPWDNVPRSAKAQEISSNRLIYGNYLQNYTIDETLKLQVTSRQKPIVPDAKLTDYEEPNLSVKSLRTYQVGVVWSDEYGRETPVMVPKQGGSVTIPKKHCIFANQLQAKILEDTVIPNWVEYASYYVKETSNEYYNLAMDRFYDAEDGNVWLSFPSAERNKVQEDTYLYLKKQHDNATAVVDKSRYKVIAISNDAPLFIKKKRRSFGFETIEYNVNGLPEAGRNFIRVAYDQFNAIFGAIVGPPALTELQLRVAGIVGNDVITSDVYDVTSVQIEGTGTSGEVKLVIENSFGSEVNALAGLNAQTQLKLEIFQNIYIDKPEFDGRFFVKILKDIALEKQLLSNFEDVYDYTVVDTMQIGYLNGQTGKDEPWWTDFNQDHENLGGYADEINRWVIDDMDTYQTGSAFNTHNINRGGAYNYKQNTLTGEGQSSGHGYLDISYCCFDDEAYLFGQTMFTTPYDRLKVADTLFRFKQDPAQVVYKVLGSKGRLGLSHNSGENAGLVGGGTTSPGDYVSYRDDGNSAWIFQDNSTAPLIGSASDYMWNHDGGSRDTHNLRASLRLKLDKMMGSGPNHIFDSSTMAPMSTKDPITGELVALVDGDRYDQAVIGGTVNGTTYPVGHYHNWYPFTSNTGAILDDSNQLVAGIEYPTSMTPNTSYGDQMNISPNYFSAWASNLYTNSSNNIILAGQPTSESSKHFVTIEFLEPTVSSSGGSDQKYSSLNPAIWETEPKEDADLDIYYEASAKIPVNPDHKQNELLVSLGATFRFPITGPNYDEYKVVDVNAVPGKPYLSEIDVEHIYNSASYTANSSPNITNTYSNGIPHDTFLRFKRYDKATFFAYVNKNGGAAAGQTKIQITTGEDSINQVTNIIQDGRRPIKSPYGLGWFNCWAFGNGVESDRVRDDFNAPQLDNGVKASTTLATPYEEERRSSGLIWSGIFNSTSGVNNLNQFIQAEPITKDLSPTYGPINKLVARETNTLAFCEDKVLNMLTNKDALFNADGNTNVTSTNNVIGQATPIQGDYGMSGNPEALAVTPMSIFWCDAYRGQVLKLSGGTTITPISDVGMKDYFNDAFSGFGLLEIIGSWDEKKDEYNVCIGYSVKENTSNSKGRLTPYPNNFTESKKTISWSEKVQGWTSFKSFAPEQGNTLNNEYFTWNKGTMYQHHVEEDTSGNTVNANYFYGAQYYSDVTLFLNDQPGSVKSFGTLNYEGTQSRITQGVATESDGSSSDGQYVNLNTKTGWYVDYLTTDLQEVGNLEFKNKEGKWFSTIKGVTTTLDNLDEREFSVQGLGNANTNNTNIKTLHEVKVKPHSASASGTNWDTTADSTLWRIHPNSVFTDYKAGISNSNNNTFQIFRYSGESIDPATNQRLNGFFLHPLGFTELDAICTGIIDNLKDNGSGVFVYSGLNLDAKDFSVPGGTMSIIGNNSAGEPIYKWLDDGSWNADTEVHYVTFENLDEPHTPNNTIRFAMFHDTFTMPAADKTIHFDIDGPSANTHGGGQDSRNLQFRVNKGPANPGSVGQIGRIGGVPQYGPGTGNGGQYVDGFLWDNISSTSASVLASGFNNHPSGYVIPAMHGWDPVGHPYQLTNEFAGVVPQYATTKVFTYKWVGWAASGLGAIGGGNPQFYLVANSDGNGGKLKFDFHAGDPYTAHFTAVYTNTYWPSHPNLIKECEVDIFYTPPINGEINSNNGATMDPDPDPSYPFTIMRSYPLCFNEYYNAQPLPVVNPAPRIMNQNVSYSSPLSQNSQIIIANTDGTGGQCNLFIKDATLNKYYNTSNDTWGSSTPYANVVTAVGSRIAQNVVLPAHTANSAHNYQYYFTVTSGGSGLVHLALSAEIPSSLSTAGSFFQKGSTTSNINIGAKTDTTRVPTLVNGVTSNKNDLGGEGKISTVRINAVYTADSNKTIAVNRQPIGTDITGGTKTITIQAAASAGTNILRVVPSEVADLPSNEVIQNHNYILQESVTTDVINSSSGGDKNDNHCSFTTADRARATVGESVTSNILPEGTLIAATNSPSGHIQFSKAFLANFSAGTKFYLGGTFKPGTKINSIAAVEGVSAYKNLTLSTTILNDIPAGTELTLNNGWNVSVRLKAEAIGTETVTGNSGSKVVSTVFNKQIYVTGTITFTTSGVINTNLTLVPNFITVS